MEKETDRNIIHIAFHSSDAYAFMTGTAIQSILENADIAIGYYIYVITADMSEDNQAKILSFNENFEKIAHKVEIMDGKKCDEYLQEVGMPKFRDSYTPYYTLMTGFFFAKRNIERIVVMDADSIVKGSLKELLDFDFKGKPLALTCQERMRVPNLPHNYRYCRSSLVLFNMPIWGKNRCQERALELVEWGRSKGYYLIQEEGIINIEFQNEIELLPLKFNLYAMTLPFSYKLKKWFYRTPDLTENELKEAIEDTQIIHFGRTFLYRPNEEGSRDRLSDLWWEYCNRSPWRGMSPTPALPLRMNEKIFRAVYKVLPNCMGDRFYIFIRHLMGCLVKRTKFEVEYFEWKKAKGE